MHSPFQTKRDHDPATQQRPAAGESPAARGRDGAPRSQRGLVPPKLYRIGEVVEYSGVSRQTIHNYTTMGLLREIQWTRGGHRLYGEEVFDRLDRIAELRAQKKSLRFIREHFAELDRTTRNASAADRTDPAG